MNNYKNIELKFEDENGKEIKLKPESYIIFAKDEEKEKIHSLMKIEGWGNFINMFSGINKIRKMLENFFSEYYDICINAFPYFVKNDMDGFLKKCSEKERKIIDNQEMRDFFKYTSEKYKSLKNMNIEEAQVLLKLCLEEIKNEALNGGEI